MRERPDALFVGNDAFFNARRVQLVLLAGRHGVPAIYSDREYAEAGGLMTYGSNIVDVYRQIGVYAGRILKGVKPADLPVVQSSKFELVINAQTARMLGLTVPDKLLVARRRGDRMIPRREFITLLGGAAAVWPLAARAQQGERMRRIGLLSGGAREDVQSPPNLAAFTKGLQALGWTDGQNLKIEYRWSAGNLDLMKEYARELVALKLDLIVAHTTQVVAALRQETTTIPIVFVVVSDPVGSGFVNSLANPGGNITGFINIESSLGGKWVELLKEVAPRTTHAAIIFNPETAPYAEYYRQPFETAARSFGIKPTAAVVRSAAEIEQALVAVGAQAGGGLVIMPDIFLGRSDNLDLIVSLAARQHLPAIYPYRFMAAAGGLLSYGIDNRDLFGRASTYVDRILKGAKPANLPVQLPTKFEFVINLKTAKALGLEMPLRFQQLADEVIE